MSVGSSALGTLLVQRLDAVLGTTMAQHANLMTGARPDAVSQAAAVARLLGPDAAGARNDRETLERTTVTDVRAGAGQGRTVEETTQDMLRAAAGRLRQTSTAFTQSAPTSLGLTARTILALLARFPDAAPPAAGRTPLWPAAPAQAGPAPGQAAAMRSDARPAATSGPPAAQAPAGTPAATAARASGVPQATLPTAAFLARALSQALDTSGLFYESHLAGLAFGKRTAAQLAAEPQAQLGTPGGSAAERPAHAAQAEANRAAEGSRASDAGRASEDARGQTMDAGRRDAGFSQTLAAGGVHPESALLVRQQLEILANQAVAWRGEPWPEADMYWEVARGDGSEPGGSESQDGWSSKLALDLPRLGRVEAVLTLRGDQLVMRLSAADSAAALQAEAETLRQRYAAAGFSLAGLSIDAGRPDAGLPSGAADAPPAATAGPDQ